jgi:hypothetical protein
MLKYRIERVVECQDWDALVEKTYGKPYCFQQQEGCQPRGSVRITIPNKWADDADGEMNDDIPFEINGDEMGVKFEKWLKTTPEDINRNNPEQYKGQNNLFWERNFYPNIDVVANDLYKKGLIEAGDYTINIDW